MPAGSHCIIFSADLADSQFPIFGAGEHACWACVRRSHGMRGRRAAPRWAGISSALLGKPGSPRVTSRDPHAAPSSPAGPQARAPAPAAP